MQRCNTCRNGNSLVQILIAFLLFHISFVALEAGVLVARAQARLIFLPIQQFRCLLRTALLHILPLWSAQPRQRSSRKLHKTVNTQARTCAKLTRVIRARPVSTNARTENKPVCALCVTPVTSA